MHAGKWDHEWDLQMSLNGKSPRIQETPETRRIAAHLNALLALIAEAKAQYLSLKTDLAATPKASVTPEQEAIVAMARHEVERLQNGYNYWKAKRVAARRKASFPAAPADPNERKSLDTQLFRRLPVPWGKLDEQPDPFDDSWMVPGDAMRSGSQMPLIIDRQLREPALPPAIGSFPDRQTEDKVCGIPPGFPDAARELWIKDRIGRAWRFYQRGLDIAKQLYEGSMQRWQVRIYYWDRRRKAAQAAGQIFNEPRPDRPEFRAPNPPKCRPANTVWL